MALLLRTFLPLLPLIAAGTTSTSTNLLVTSYTGTLTTLNYTHGCNTPASPSTFSAAGHTLTQTFQTNNTCGPDPTWLTLDPHIRILYCLGEGDTTPNGSVSTFSLSPSGNATPIATHPTIAGPVNLALFGPNNSALAIAHYGGGGALSTFHTDHTGALNPAQNITFFMPAPGPASGGRQSTPHAHEALLDPTGAFMLVPDLGADLVRVFAVDPSSQALAERAPLKMKPGSGPRHAAFWSIAPTQKVSPLYLYVVSEIGGTITGFSVSYNQSELAFKQVYEIDTLGGFKAPGTVAPAEVLVSPDNQFVLVSNRNDSSFVLPNPDPKNATGLVSDSVATFRPDAKTGGLGFVQLAAAGGRFPRNMDLGRDGTGLAVGLQNDGRVVVLEREAGSGVVGGVLAAVEGLGAVTRVLWDD